MFDVLIVAEFACPPSIFQLPSCVGPVTFFSIQRDLHVAILQRITVAFCISQSAEHPYKISYPSTPLAYPEVIIVVAPPIAVLARRPSDTVVGIVLLAGYLVLNIRKFIINPITAH